MMRNPARSILLFCSAALVLLLAVPLYADDIAVTGVTLFPAEDSPGRRPTADITINGCLKLREAEVAEAGGRTFLRFPEYVSRSKRSYPQITLLTRQADTAARSAVSSGKSQGAGAGRLSFSIAKISRYRRPSSLKAFCSVVFNDAVQVECKVLEGKNGLWVAWPARRPKGGGKWIEQVVFLDRGLKEDVETRVLERYRSLASEAGNGGLD